MERALPRDGGRRARAHRPAPAWPFVALAAWPLALILRSRHEKNPVAPVATGAARGAAIGAVAWVLVALWCPLVNPAHLALGHFLPLLLLSALGSWLGQRVTGVAIRWTTRRHRRDGAVCRRRRERLGELYDLRRVGLYGYLLRRTRNADEAEDLLQQTLLQVHRARASFVPGADVLPWLFAIARRLVIDQARKAHREPVVTRDVDVLDVAAHDAFADDVVHAQQLVVRFEDALAQLPEPQRLAFDLLKRRGLSLSETADSLQITVGAVSSASIVRNRRCARRWSLTKSADPGSRRQEAAVDSERRTGHVARAASEQSHSTAPAISSSVAMRPIGCCATRLHQLRRDRLGLPHRRRAVTPAHRAFTRMPRAAYSSATDRVIPRTACFDAT